MIRGVNQEKISNQVVKPKIIERQVTGRDKAIEFAKNVPKPKLKTILDSPI